MAMANDVYTWVPPTPAGVLNETQSLAAGGGSGFFQSPSLGPTGDLGGMGYTPGWTCQTYLSLGTAGIALTYS
jgi:hypothetical protein